MNASSNAVKIMIDQYDAYLGSQNLTSNNYEIRNDLTIRVPIDQFEPLMDALTGEGTFIKQRQVTSRDVTEEFLDIQTRLKTKKAVRDRYIEVLRTKAKNVEEILKAEEAIRVVQEEIESREGRLNYLKDKTSWSTIHLHMYQELDYTPEPVYRRGFGKRLVSALQTGWDLIQEITLGLITIWPLLIIFGVLIWQRKRIFKWRRKKDED